MMILDTSVISETQKALPDSNVMNFLENLDPTSTYITSVTVSEILSGIGILPSGRCKQELEEAARAIFQSVFKHRVLPFDIQAAARYAVNAAEARKQGKEITPTIGMIAGIASVNGGSVVATRETSSFEAMRVTAVDPWAAPKIRAW